MMKILRFFGKLIGAVLVLVLIFSIFTSIFVITFTTQIFNADLYLEAFEEQEFFDRLPGIAATQIRYSMGYNPCLENPDMCENDGLPEENGEGGPPSYFQALSKDDWETILQELLPSDWLENQVHDLIHGLIDSVRSGSEEIKLGISLLDLKDNLTGQAGVEAITKVLEAQPECSDDDLLAFTRILEGTEESGADFLSCRPGVDILENYAPQIEALLTRSLKDIPDEIDFTENLDGDGLSIEIFSNDVPVTVFINFIRRVILLSPLLNIMLMLVIAALAVHSFKGLRGWWGYPTAIAGLLATALASLASPAANFIIDRFLADPPMAGLHDELVDAASGVALEMIRLIFTQARNYALIVTGIGLMIIIIPSVFKDGMRRDQKDLGGESIPDDDLGNAVLREENLEEIIVTEVSPEIEEKRKRKRKKKNKKKKESDTGDESNLEHLSEGDETDASPDEEIEE